MFERQVSHLSRIIDDLLDVSRIPQGVVSLRKEPLDLAELVETTIADYHSLFDSKKIILECKMDSLLWVEGDRTRLRQIISNLLTNAAKFTPNSGCVKATLQKDGNTVQFILEDSGCGMDSRTIQKLFQPHSQGPITIDRQGAGLGLGSFLVKGLTELHQGKVSVSSAGLGLGSKFVVELPLSSLRAQESANSPARTVKTRRIIIIEDNEDAARALEMVLKFRGHEVAVAGTGRAGIDLVAQLGADSVICDIGLPGDLDGYAVARELRNLYSSSRLFLVAATGYGLASDKTHAIEAGFDCHLTKPIDISQVEKLFGVSGDRLAG